MHKILLAFLLLIGLFKLPAADVKAASIKDPVANPNQISYESTLIIGRVPFQAVGSEFNVPVNIVYGGKQLCAVRANLSFPPDMLEVVSLNHGPLFSLEMVKKFNNSAGTVSYTLAPGGGCVKQNTTVYTVRFRAKFSGNAPIRFSAVTVASGEDGGISYPITVYKIENTVWINNDFVGASKTNPSSNYLPEKIINPKLNLNYKRKLESKIFYKPLPR